MSRLCHQVLEDASYYFLPFIGINSTGSLPFGLYDKAVLLYNMSPQLDPEHLLRDALAGHSQCRAGPWPVFQVFYELHSGFRLNLKIWSGQGAKMTGTPLKVPWPQETWNCWYREWPAIFQPRLPADMNHPHTSHSKSQQKLASENSISTHSIQPVSWIWFPKVG